VGPLSTASEKIDFPLSTSQTSVSGSPSIARTVSAPAPVVTVSLPKPGSSRSSPPRPSSVSLPSAPMSMLAASSPMSVSANGPPSTFSTWALSVSPVAPSSARPFRRTVTGLTLA
jgi:hypothetical protein